MSFGAAIAATALFSSGLGCGRKVMFDPASGGGDTGGGGGIGGNGGQGGATTSSSTSDATCEVDDDCLDLSGQCVIGACEGGRCVVQPANQNGACDDGLFCTLEDRCDNGVCVGGPTLECPSDSPCLAATCDEVTDTCVTQPGNDGAQCDDGDPCTYAGTCQGGTCMKGAPVNCSALDGDCTVGVCDPERGCQPAPANDGAPCDDGLYCTAGDTCQGGVCTGGGALPCAPPGGCFVGVCDEATDDCVAVPGNDGAACDDGSPCTASTTCLAGVCGNGVPTNDGAACEDGASCTVGDTCLAGVCKAGTGPTVYFADDFKDDSKGWILGQEWEIGPAMMSQGGFSNGDPGVDHSPTDDNGIAGVVIGGNATTAQHPYYYLESPAFDTSAAEGPVVLGFYRWLNSDYSPWMNNTVEVWAGAQWITLWTSGPPPAVEDDAWTFQQFDLTAFKNASMRIRFGVNVAMNGAFVSSSWNIDDVLVASAACP